jgi:hypothetical protein
MNKKILEEKIYYYEDGVKDFDLLMNTIDELDKLEEDSESSTWFDWTASNDKDFIYGSTKTFDIAQINNLEEPYKSKMAFVYKTIMDSFYDVSKDYATALGDNDEPRLFPTFNIKKYAVGTSMGAHFDQLDGDQTLRYSLVMYLNDDFEGGEISFTMSDYQGVLNKTTPHPDYNHPENAELMDFSIKPKAGSIIIFPSSAPYHHTAHLVKTGFKYMVPGHWIHNNMELHKGSM